MSWTYEQRSAVWFKATAFQGGDGNKWRLDACGALIGWNFYGNRDSQYGWEIDHINPTGGDGLENLRPLQWQNNVKKSDGKLVCAVKASGQHNVPIKRPLLHKKGV